MNKLTKVIALLCAFCIFTACSTSDYPQIRGVGQSSVAQIAKSISDMMLHTYENPLFSSLSYHAEEQQIYMDGVPCGKRCGDYYIDNGALYYRGEKVDAAAESLYDYNVYQDTDGLMVTAPFQTGTLIVKSDKAVSLAGITEQYDDGNSLQILQFESPEAAKTAYEILRQEETVSYVQPNLIYHVCDDVMYHGTRMTEEVNWGIDAIGASEFLADLPVDDPHTVTVAVMDTGIYPEHEMFVNRLADGAVSFVEDSDASWEDWHGHGTHCAGIICSVTDEYVKVLPIKAMGDDGLGSSLSLYCAMLYAAEQNVDVVSMSLGGIGDDPLLEEAARMLSKKGIPCIVAAGNENMDVQYVSPANIPETVTISAVHRQSETGAYSLASFSNHGDAIDFSAPGSGIYSAGIDAPNDYLYKSGTSMATPFVAGCMANLLRYQANYTIKELYDLLRINVLDLGEEGKDRQFGWGMVQLREFQYSIGNCAPPAVSVQGGVYHNVLQVALTSATPDAEIYYTLDGTKPGRKNGLLYDGTPIPVTKTTDLRAVSMTESDSSRAIRVRYQIAASMPSSSVGSGSYDEGFSVRLSADENATIYYTLDGSEPTADCGVVYDGTAIDITQTTVLQAIAVVGDMFSNLLTETYVIGNRDFDRLFLIEDGVLKKYYGNMTELDLRAMKLDSPLTAIGDGAFQGNNMLKSMVLPETVTELGAHAFDGCTRLITLDASGVVSLLPYALASCTALKRLTLGDVRTLPAYVFYRAKQIQWNALDLTGVTAIGDYAFYGCNSLTNIRIQWERITEIGQFCFGQASYAGTLQLDSLCYLASDAFRGLDGAFSVTLPSTMTAIPERAFFESSLISLEAMGVTEVAAYALADLNYVMEHPLQLVIDHEKLVSVGDYAFRGCCFHGELHFDALQWIGEGAFSEVSAEILSFPLLAYVPYLAFGESTIQTLYLERVVQIADMALQGCQMVIVGDALESIEYGAMIDGGSAILFAGSIDSPMQQFCISKGIPYVCTPAVYLPVREMAVTKYTELPLQGIPLGFGYDICWQRFSEPIPSVLYQMEFSGDVAETTEIGTSYYFAKLESEDRTIYSEAVTVTVNGIPESSGTIADCDEPIVIDWNTVSGDSVCYTFIPSESKPYYIFADIPETAVFAIRDQRYVYQTGSGMKPETLKEIRLNADTPYQILVMRQSDNRYTVLRCADYIPSSMKNTDIVVSDENPILAGEIPDYPYVSVMTGLGLHLEEGTDYIVCCDGEDTVGSAMMYLFGIGSYSGCRKKEYPIYGNLTSEKSIEVSDVQENPFYFRFQPEKTAMYTFFVSCAEKTLEDVLLAGNLDSFEKTGLALDVLQSDRKIIASDTSDGFGFPDVTVSLTAGETYYLTISGNGTLTDLQLCVSEKRQNIASVNPTFQQLLDFDGYTPEPAVQLLDDDGNVLEQGQDYRVCYMNHRFPGTMSIICIGIGNYYGMIWENCEIAYDFERYSYLGTIVPNRIFPLATGYSEYTCVIPQRAIFRLTCEEESAVSARFYTDDLLKGWQEYGTLQADGTCMLEAGSYRMMVWQESEEMQDVCLQPVQVIRRIEDASIVVKPATYTGEPIEPEIVATDQYTQLHLNVDFVIIPDDEMTSCGYHSFTIEGIGRYTGSVRQSVLIATDIPSGLPLLTEGDHQAIVNHGGESIQYLWLPEPATYCFRKTELLNSSIAIVDAEKKEQISFSGIGSQYLTIETCQGRSYLVTISYGSAMQTGAISFSLFSDFRELSNCRIESDRLVKKQEGDTIPSYRLLDGDTELVEGIDYGVLYTGGDNACGYAERGFYGMGRYVGMLDFGYYIYPDVSQLQTFELKMLNLDEPFTIERGYPGIMNCFTYTAQQDGIYGLQLPTMNEEGVTAFVYRDGENIPQYGCDSIELSKGETIKILCATSRMSTEFEPDDTFSVMVSDESLTMQYQILTADGFTYQIENGKATLIAIPRGIVGFTIPSRVIGNDLDAEDGKQRMAYFHEIDEALLPYIQANCTIYGDSDVAAYCMRNGICFSFVQPDTNVFGDVTGDGVVDWQDAVTLLRWLGEGVGMRMSDAAYHNADFDGDGVVTSMDAVAILSAA